MSTYHVITKRVHSFVQKPILGLLSFSLLAGLTAASGVAQTGAQSGLQMDHSDHLIHGHAPAELVKVVREATYEFLDVNATHYAGYEPALGCVSGPDHGAMGVHYINGSLLNGDVDARKPQALIYEPLGGGRMRLVGVEYIVDSAAWFKKQKQEGVKDAGPPALYGQLFQLVASPNRYNLDTFFELHVWAWQDNPNGTFVDWNNQVSCDRQGKTLQ